MTNLAPSCSSSSRTEGAEDASVTSMQAANIAGMQQLRQCRNSSSQDYSSSPEGSSSSSSTQGEGSQTVVVCPSTWQLQHGSSYACTLWQVPRYLPHLCGVQCACLFDLVKQV
eukprot:CAMPEP_0202896812 /NCGR_PEP_ID=MMETSP1392-20130828/5734_1 /ASSEMBLY_ACC=CAM_ASM_000868 /TAXON_ID=225041 /ORGANISM="Chlamydomonas chlamydogama, Strain SAG 11-48b" /LENGTH=112 /DNA_ID=CAMNT_0049582289 /DNA_START=32 /DNA_END=371 /DNA_ORIENTATION=-